MPLQLVRFPVAQCREEVSFEDGFLYPREGGLHHGIDISGPLGTPILAPVSGSVVVRCRLGGERRDGVGNSPKGGNYAVIAADDGHFHYFAHMQATIIQTGSRISAGSSIGYLGDSGNAAGRPHLHYQVWAPFRHQGSAEEYASHRFVYAFTNPQNPFSELVRLANALGARHNPGERYFVPPIYPMPASEVSMDRTGRGWTHR
jgi:murein DD-endopeptidase MepM/ murein hydrolase activator NlpD